jgi:hypothetical protein
VFFLNVGTVSAYKSTRRYIPESTPSTCSRQWEPHIITSSARGIRSVLNLERVDLRITMCKDRVDHPSSLPLQLGCFHIFNSLIRADLNRKAVPWLRLVADLSPRWPRSFHVGFVVDKAALVLLSLYVLAFPPSVSFLLGCPYSLSSGGWTIGPLVAAVQRQSHPIDMNNKHLNLRRERFFCCGVKCPLVPFHRSSLA